MWYVLLFLFVADNRAAPENVWGPTPLQFIQMHNYTGEEHRVRTNDGYVLTLHRVRPSSAGRPPVLVVHGLACHAGHFLMSSDGLPYALNEAGYDVWLLSARGTIWSRDHDRRSAGRVPATYWHFSFHEMGVYDSPATIDYILGQTGAQNLTYIGHSQGGAMFLVMAAKRPAYNRKINLAILLAPGVLHRSFHTSYVFHFLGPILSELLIMADKFKWHKIGITARMRIGMAQLCSVPAHRRYCSQIIGTPMQIAPHYLDQEVVPHFLWASPSPIAVQQLRHFLQNAAQNRFAEYDFGTEGNLRRYGKSVPPEYNLSNVIAPVQLYYSEHDFLVPADSILELRRQLPNVKRLYLVPRTSFQHCDYFLATDRRQLVHEPIIEALRKIHD